MSGSTFSRSSLDKAKHSSSDHGRDQDRTLLHTEQNPHCMGCNTPGHLREACFFQTHPDFNKMGRWEGCKADRELKARGKTGRELKLEWKSRADGTYLPAEASPADGTPIPTSLSQHGSERSPTMLGTCSSRSGWRAWWPWGSGQVHFNKDKGTSCLTSIITHLSCNCSGADINSTYRQCLVSITALTLFNTGAYTSFVNREVAKWLELQQHGGTVAGAHHARPTTEVGLAGAQLHSSIYGTVVFDLTFFNEITKYDNILKSIEANVIDTCTEVIIGLPDIRSHRLVHRIPSYFDSRTSGYPSDNCLTSTKNSRATS